MSAAAVVMCICNVCNSSGIKPANVNDHMTKHLDDKICTSCKVEVDDVELHVNKHIKKLFKCPTCGEMYSSTRDYRAHRNTHVRHICFHCGLSCSTLEQLKDHCTVAHSGKNTKIFEGTSEIEGESGPLVKDDTPGGMSENIERLSDIIEGNPQEKLIKTGDVPEEIHQSAEAVLSSGSTKRKRGRPKKIVSQVTAEVAPTVEEIRIVEEMPPLEEAPKRKRGRPKGPQSRVSSITTRGTRRRPTVRKTATENPKVKKATCGETKEDVDTVSLAKFKCETCGETFDSKRKLRGHMNTAGCHLCTYCGAKFKQKNNLMMHTRIHTGEKPHLCSLCGKKFRTKSDMNGHMRRHTNDKPYQCRYCPKRFVEIGHRNRHEKVHTGEKQYQCPTCGKMFSLSYHVRRHAAVHTGEKQFECSICGKRIADPSNFKKHLSVHKKRRDQTKKQEQIVPANNIGEAHEVVALENIQNYETVEVERSEGTQVIVLQLENLPDGKNGPDVGFAIKFVESISDML